MRVPTEMSNIQLPTRIWIEPHDGGNDACDVIVEMEDGTIFTSLFITPHYLNRQMGLTYHLCEDIPDTVPVRFAVLDTPHIAVEALERNTIEDAIDNLLAMEVFESVFIQVTENPAVRRDNNATPPNGHRTTQEVAAVVLSDVLVVQEQH